MRARPCCLVIVVLAASPGCERAPAKPAATAESADGLHCRMVVGRPDYELFFPCFLDQASCEWVSPDNNDHAFGFGTCEAVIADWHCHTMTTPNVSSQACFATRNDCTVSRHRNFGQPGSGKVSAGSCERAAEVHCFDEKRRGRSCFSTTAMCAQERAFMAELFPELSHGPCTRR